MRILSFDTSTANLYACLTEQEKIIAEQTLICDKGPAICCFIYYAGLDQLFEKSDWHKARLEVIAVGIGPGSFTGTRVAVVTGRTLCQALNFPLLGINRFQCYAFKEQIGVFRQQWCFGWQKTILLCSFKR